MVSLQFLAVAILLYIEVAITLALVLPFIKPWLWRKVFGLFKVLARFKSTLNLFYVGTLGVLVLLFLLFVDSIREMIKFSQQSGEQFAQHEQELDRHMKMFRAQRNFYIVGFALFLFVVIRRLSSLISTVAKLEASNAALETQGRNTSQQLLITMKSTDDSKDSKKTKMSETVSSSQTDDNVGPSQQDFEDIVDELEKTRKNLAAMKRQSESTSAEYDRLSSEYQKLQNQLEDSGPKKDN